MLPSPRASYSQIIHHIGRVTSISHRSKKKTLSETSFRGVILPTTVDEMMAQQNIETDLQKQVTIYAFTVTPHK
jgi:hypothetical protein